MTGHLPKKLDSPVKNRTLDNPIYRWHVYFVTLC